MQKLFGGFKGDVATKSVTFLLRLREFVWVGITPPRGPAETASGPST